MALPSLAHAADKPNALAIPITTLLRTDTVDFEREILPILRDSCLACHNRTRAKADLNLETPVSILKGGENGPAVIPGKSDLSLMLQVASHRVEPIMPPKENKASAADLTSEQLGLLRLWIDQGAKGEVHGSQPITWISPAKQLQPVYAIVLTSDGRFAAAGRSNTIDLYDVACQRPIGSLTDPALQSTAAHREMVESLAFSPDGSTLASGGFGEVKLWHRTPSTRMYDIALAPTAQRVSAVSSDGKWLAIAAEGRPIDLVDAVSGRTVGVVPNSTSAAHSLAFTPDGTKLAVISEDHGLRICAIPSGVLLAQTVIPSDPTSLAWTSNTTLATSAEDGIVRELHLPGKGIWTPPLEIKGHGGAMTATAPTANGARIISGGSDGIIHLWSLADGSEVRKWPNGPSIVKLAVRPDGKTIAVIGADHVTRLWSDQGTKIADCKGDMAWDQMLSASERAQKVATADVVYFKAAADRDQAEQTATKDRLAKATSARDVAMKNATDKEQAKMVAATEHERAQKTSDSAKTLFDLTKTEIAAREKSLDEARRRFSDARSDDAIEAETIRSIENQVNFITKELDDLKSKAKSLATDPKPQQTLDAATKALADADAQLTAAKLTRSNAQTEYRLAVEAHDAAAARVVTSRAAAGQSVENAKIADAAMAAAKQHAAVSTDLPSRDLAFSPDNHLLATVTADARVHLWSADTGLPLQTLETNASDLREIFFVQSSLFAVGQTRLECWSLGGDWSLAQTLTGDTLIDRVGALAFSPDGHLIATGSGEPTRSGRIAIWNAQTATLVHDCGEVHSDSVLSLAFSPDGKQLASGGADRLAKILDVPSGKVIYSLEGHTGHVLGVAWKADGRTLATSAADKQVKFWDTTTGDKRASAAVFAKDVMSVSFIDTTDQVIAAGSDGQVKILNEAAAVTATAAAPGPFLQCAAITSDARLIAVGEENGSLIIWRDLTKPPALNLTALSRGK